MAQELCWCLQVSPHSLPNYHFSSLEHLEGRKLNLGWLALNIQVGAWTWSVWGIEDSQVEGLKALMQSNDDAFVGSSVFNVV